MDTRVAVISIIVENPEAMIFFMKPEIILSGVWGFHIGKKELISSVLQLMHRRI